MPAASSLRARLLQLAREALAQITSLDAEPFTVVILGAGAKLVFTSRPGEFPDQPLTDMQRAILSVCTTEPQTAKRIASRSGYAYSSRLRSEITELCRQGILQRTPDGVRVTGGPQQPPPTVDATGNKAAR